MHCVMRNWNSCDDVKYFFVKFVALDKFLGVIFTFTQCTVALSIDGEHAQ
jgi:hypothetical protein